MSLDDEMRKLYSQGCETLDNAVAPEDRSSGTRSNCTECALHGINF